MSKEKRKSKSFLFSFLSDMACIKEKITLL